MKKPSKSEALSIIPVERIENIIHLIHGQKVMLDRDLAKLYGVETRTLNQAVTRNIERFPLDFAFQLSRKEMENWISQIVISNSNIKMGLRKLPYAFTEQGVAMLSSVLRSPRAVKVNIEIMRAFVRMRQAFASQEKLSKSVSELRDFVLKNSSKTNREFQRIWRTIEKLAEPLSTDYKNRPRIGFDVESKHEDASRSRSRFPHSPRRRRTRTRGARRNVP